MWGKPKVEVHCSECKKSTTIDIPEQVQCNHCEKIVELKGSFIKGFGKKTILATVIASGIAVTQVDDILYPNHYPSEVQYAIIEGCIAGDSSQYFSISELKRKRTICACAFDKARKNIGYESFQSNPNYLVSELHNKVERCSN